VLGIDETRRGKPRWVRDAEGGRWVRVDPWDTGFVDLAGHQGLLGQTEGRTSKTVTDWLNARSEGACQVFCVRAGHVRWGLIRSG